MSCYHLNITDDIIISDVPSGNLAWPCENTIYVYKSFYKWANFHSFVKLRKGSLMNMAIEHNCSFHIQWFPNGSMLCKQMIPCI